MGVNGVRGTTGVVTPSVPNHQLLVISDRPEKGFVQQMPSNIFDNGGVARKDSFSIKDTILSGRGINVPKTNGVVIGSGE